MNTNQQIFNRMQENKILENAFNDYFASTKPKESGLPQPAPNVVDADLHAEKGNRHLFNRTVDTEYMAQSIHAMADGNMDALEEIADVIKRLCNAAWGEGWGECSPDLKYGEDSKSIILPQIVLDMNARDISEEMSGLKPRLTDTIEDTDERGEPTGDTFLVYRQWFDCNIEFDFYGRNSKEARQLMNRFESLITTYAGYLKRNGISEIYFEKEISPKFSLNYNESSPMRCIFYYVRLEKITPVRSSTINSINMELGIGRLDNERYMAALSSGQEVDPVELAFFEGDTGMTYNL